MAREIKWHRGGESRYEGELGDGVVAFIALTGRPGVDNYPWDWSIDTDEYRDSGVADTLRSAKEKVADSLRKGETSKLPAYVVEGLNLSNGRREQVAALRSSVRVIVAGLAFTITDRDGSVTIAADPVNGQAVGVDVEEISYGSPQFRAVLRGSKEVK